MNKSLGVIETRGYSASVIAANVACKASSVNIISYQKIGSGFVSVCFEGEVSAVQAGIESAILALSKEDLLGSLVIARPGDGVVKCLMEIGMKKPLTVDNKCFTSITIDACKETLLKEKSEAVEVNQKPKPKNYEYSKANKDKKKGKCK